MKRFWMILVMCGGLALAQNKVDDRIYDEVRMKLAADINVNGGALDVDVKEGVVTLKGRVKSEKGRQRAEKVAAKVKGVKSVNNQLKVDPNAH